jgi:hypothetical protein
MLAKARVFEKKGPAQEGVTAMIADLHKKAPVSTS